MNVRPRAIFIPDSAKEKPGEQDASISHGGI
jgi:hypothetical protein